MVQGQAMPVDGEVHGQVVTVHQPQAAIATPVPVHVQGQVLATPAPVVQGQVIATPAPVVQGQVMARPQVMAQPQVMMAQPGQPGAVVPFGGGTGIPGAPPGGVNVNINWCGPISWSICFVASRAPELRRAPRASFVRRLHATLRAPVWYFDPPRRSPLASSLPLVAAFPCARATTKRTTSSATSTTPSVDSARLHRF